MTDITQTGAPGPLQGNVLFYSRPEPLSSETHAKLGLRRIARPYGFAEASHVIPLTVTEFPQAALASPIIFAGDRHQPLAVMGVNARRNIYIRDDGTFEPGVYIPAYVRRYPFVLASDDAREKMVVCIDRDAPMVGDLPDVALFDAEGQPTDYTKSCIDFCNNFEVELRRTESFVSVLTELDLFETKTASYNPVNPDGTAAGPPQLVAEYYAVSEEKLKAL
ncbi:MAG TPA: SapC family protein, partial [Caulobacteraceae bacterium]|nr:SapC family protein [Caulobacteraceae bacterium]